MTAHNEPDTSPEFFDRLYKECADPWDFQAFGL